MSTCLSQRWCLEKQLQGHSSSGLHWVVPLNASRRVSLGGAWGRSSRILGEGVCLGLGVNFHPAQNKMVMITLIKRKGCHDRPLQATPPSVDMWAITKSIGNEGRVTLMKIYGSTSLIAFSLLQINRMPCAKTSFAKPGPSGEREWVQQKKKKKSMKVNGRSAMIK